MKAVIAQIMGNRVLNYAWRKHFGLEKLVWVQFGEGETTYITQ